MSTFWSAVTHGLTPYVPGEQPKIDNLIKLNTNEHPYGPSPKALDAMRDAVGDTLRLYPDPNAEALKRAIAARYGVAAGQVFVGNGSDEVLAHAFQGLLKHAAPVWLPDITYSFYPVYCGLYAIEYRAIPLDAQFGIAPDDYLPRGSAHAGGVVIANPNAPTGRPLALDDIERIVAANPQCVVLVDEAYVDFGADSAISLVSRYPNLLVVHTLSKSRALAGLRVGYAIGDSALIDGLERVKNSFNSYPLGRIAIAGAVAAIEDDAHLRENCQRVIASRTRLTQALNALGFEVLPSAANFIFARHPDHDGAALAAQLRQQAILVRHFRAPRIEPFLRITIGTDAQCDRLVEVLRTLV